MNTKEFIGDFVMNIYDKGLVSNRPVPTNTVQELFEKYLKEKKKTTNCTKNKKTEVGVLLRRFDFLYTFNAKFIQFRLGEVRQYRRKLIEDRDKKTIDAIRIGDFKSNFSTVTNNTPKLLASSEEIKLSFFFSVKQQYKPFIVTSKGCFCCQENFENEDLYERHIEKHTEATNFEFGRTNIAAGRAKQQLNITYWLCESSPHLCLSIKAKHAAQIIIEKIMLFRFGVIHYLEETVMPYQLPADGSNFYMNCHLFQVAQAQPLLVIFKLENGEKNFRYVEEHHFFRMDHFPVALGLKSKRVCRRTKLDFGRKKLLEFLPNEIAKSISRFGHEKFSNNIKSCVSNYLNGTIPLDAENIAEVFDLLIQMEDFEISKRYQQFNQLNVRVNGCGRDYSMEIKLVKENQDFECIINPGDRVVLTTKHADKKTGKLKQFFGTINNIATNRVYFETRKSNVPIDKIYNVAFEPQRLNIIYQHYALRYFKNDRNLRKRLFPEIEQRPNEIEQDNNNNEVRLAINNPRILKNPEQSEAVYNIASNTMGTTPFVIFGPPGTGKTTLVVEAILQLKNKSPNNRILVTAGSNAACDEIASRLCEFFNRTEPENLNLLRIYALSVENRLDNLNEAVLEVSNLCYGQHFYPSLHTIYEYPIVICTLSVSGKLVHAKIQSDHFTHIFIDECGASTEPECFVSLAGILSPKAHLIVSGDPKQLGPIIINGNAKKYGLYRSLLERLMNCECYQVNAVTKKYDKRIQARLVRNFRSHKNILELSNALYYNGELKAEAPSELTNWALAWPFLRNRNFPIIWLVIRGKMTRPENSTSLQNHEELSEVMLCIKEMKYFGIKGRQISDEDIGVISPYRKQCQLIRSELDRRGWLQIETGSVETFQGKEKSIIIASTVRSKTSCPGFLENPKRLNVLLTRAQALLILVGNSETMKQFGDWRYVVEYCENNGAIIDRNPKSSIGNAKK